MHDLTRPDLQPCLEEDDWTRERRIFEPRWILTLTDGSRVIQDDNRPGREPNAWQRYLKWRKLQELYTRFPMLAPRSLHVEFRDQVLAPLPEYAEGYLFRKAMMAQMGGPANNLYVLGWVSGDKVHIQRWHVPEFTKLNEQVVPLEQYLDSILFKTGR